MELTNNYQVERLMIVDDTEIDRYVATHFLNKHHFAREIIQFDMATKAIDYLELHQNDPEKLPQLILLDIRMPVMDGFQFLKKLATLPRFANYNGCIIMISSSLDPHDHERARTNPMVKAFVNKPLSNENLRSITELLQHA